MSCGIWVSQCCGAPFERIGTPRKDDRRWVDVTYRCKNKKCKKVCAIVPAGQFK